MCYSGEFCFFETKDNYKLEGLFNGINSEVCIINVHGMGSSFWSNVGLTLFELGKENNLGTFIFNNRGAGIVRKLSPWERDSKDKISAGFVYEIFEDSINDIAGAINFLKKLKGFKKFILSGHSTGAQKVLHYMLNSNNSDIIGIILGGAGDDLNLMKHWHKDYFEELKNYCNDNIEDDRLKMRSEIGLMSNKRFYDLVKETSVEGNLFNFEKDLSHIKKIDIPILIFYGKEDEFTIIGLEKQGNMILDNCINKKSKLVFVPGDHSVRGGEKELKKEVITWINNL